MSDKMRVPIRTEYDIVTARHQVKETLHRFEFLQRGADARGYMRIGAGAQIVEYAGTGEMIMGLTDNKNEKGIIIIAKDQGPGIPDIELAMKDGYSTSKGLGIGLPGCRRIMDEFEIVSRAGKGTTVTVKKWKR